MVTMAVRKGFIVRWFVVLSSFLLMATNGLVPNQQPQRQRQRQRSGWQRKPSATSGTLAPLPATTASPLEEWCVTRLEDWYTRSFRIKCPFFRRRAADALDALNVTLSAITKNKKNIKGDKTLKWLNEFEK